MDPDSEKRIQAFKTKCLRRLCIFYLVHKTHNWVRRKISSLVGPWESLLVTVKRQKLAWFGMSCTITVSPKPSFRAPWRVGNTVIGEEMLDGQHKRMDIPTHARTAHSSVQKIIPHVPLKIKLIKGLN